MNTTDVGLIGLGVMGQNFVLNLERNGCTVTVYNRNPEKTREFVEGSAAGLNILAAYSFQELVASIERPRRIMLLVKAGQPVDWTLHELLPYVEPGDLIIDGGNSHFTDTERRARELSEKGIEYIGMGVSGGEEGALWGPSLMPGGSAHGFAMIESIMSKVAAKAEEDGSPCVAWIGPGGAGHYVKMVHNGIEYADMQLIAEVYDILRHTLHLSAGEFHALFSEWNTGPLSSYLIEVTSKVFTKIDEQSGMPLVDMILDVAGQKGTGIWTSHSAADLGVAVPTITSAVDMRFLSGLKQERTRAAAELPGPEASADIDPSILITAVRDALSASKICSYAQGMSLLRSVSHAQEYHLDLSTIAKIWRAGCIIRAELLNEIALAFLREPELPNLLFDTHFQSRLAAAQSGWRFAIKTAIGNGIPVPALSASLAYYDAYRSDSLPANLIQAQRDFFGAHTFERIDGPGIFHAEWEGEST